MKKFFSSTVCILPFLLAAPVDGGGGGQPAAPPEIVGDTHEAKLTDAKTKIGAFFADVARLTKELATAVAEKTRVTGLFDALTTTAEKEKIDHAATKNLLETEKGAHTVTKGLVQIEQGKISERDKTISQLEKFCDLKGLDPKEAVKIELEDKKTGGGANLWDEYQELRKKETAGQVDPGTAQAFWVKNKTALNVFAASRRDRRAD
jgi:hypothetical protein